MKDSPTAKRSRQTQLSFSPLPSSSPVSSSYPKQIRDRAAVVRFDVSPTPSPAKKRRVGVEALASRNGGGGYAPRSSISSPSGRPTGMFAGGRVARVSDEESSASSSERLPRAPRDSREKERTTTAKKMAKGGRNVVDDATPLLRSPSGKRASATSGEASAVGRTSTSSANSPATRTLRSAAPKTAKTGSGTDKPSIDARHKRQMAAVVIPSGDERFSKRSRGDSIDDSEDSRVRIPARKPRTRTRIGKRDGEREARNESASSSDALLVTDGSKTHVADKASSGGSRANRPASTPPDQGEEDDEMPRSTVRRRAVGRGKIGQRTKADAEDDGGDGSDKGSEEEAEGAENGGDEIPRSTGKRELRRTRKPSAENEREEQEREDLEEDLEFLGSSDMRSTREKPAQSARKRALEALKKRRASKREISSSQTAPPSSCAVPELSEDEILVENESEEQEQEVDTYDADADIFREDEEDQYFIASDVDESLGVPDAAIPIEYTRYASMKASELFKFAVEWMVQKKLNPAFAATDPVYRLTFTKLDREVASMADSNFVSSVWREDS